MENETAAKAKFSVTDNNSKEIQPLKLKVLDYMTWIENKQNGLKVEKKIGDFTYTALYKPYEYLALMELKKENVDKKELYKKMDEYDGLQYYTFRITAENQQQELLKVGISSDADYYSRIEYCSFKMQNDFKLMEGKDTLDCVLFHFERIYGLAPYATFVLGFPLGKNEQNNNTTITKSNDDKTILYADQIFGSGNIYMTITKEDLNNVPELITN
jgi:hypothetical protein